MPTIDLPYTWSPRPYQLPLWKYRRNGGKRAVEVGHRRWGKDLLALNDIAVSAHERVGTYWHMLPQYEQCRKAIWDAIDDNPNRNPDSPLRLIDQAFPLAIRESTYKQRMMIKFKCGSTYQLVGSDNFDALVGSSPIGIVFSEYAVGDPLSWAYMRPILLQNNGWATFIYTPRGDNHGKYLYNLAREDQEMGGEWFAELSTVADTNVFTQSQLDDELKQYMAEWGPEEGEALFNQEFYCSFGGAQPGAYYMKVVNEARHDGRITFVPYTIGHKVFTFWDLGVDDTTAIWFMQHVGQQYNFIDYYEDRRKGMDHYAHYLLHDLPYVYGDHFMPHDVLNTNIQTNQTTQEYAEGLGIYPIVPVEKPKDSRAIIVGVNQARRLFNRCFFDEKKCAHGLSALINYRSEYDTRKRISSNYPVHDWSSHGADAFRVFATGYQPPIKHETVTQTMQRLGLRMG